jgi:hypothetical protein
MGGRAFEEGFAEADRDPEQYELLEKAKREVEIDWDL